MVFRFSFLVLIAAACSAWLAACKSLPAGHGPQPAKGSVATTPGEAEPSPEKIAQAHAHFAAGVISESKEDPDPQAALREYYAAALDDPDDESLNLRVSESLLQSKQPEKALEVLERAAARPHATGLIFARLGTAYAELGKTNLAIQANRTALTKSPGSLAGYQNLCLNYLHTKQPQEALKVLDVAARQPDVDAEFLLGLAKLYGNVALEMPAQSAEAKAKALAVLNRAEQLSPDNPSLRLRLAEAFSQQGDSAKAAHLYLELLKKLPEVPFLREQIHAKLTDIYLRSQDHKAALEQLQAIIRDDPANPQAYYYLGSICFEDKKLPEAVDYFSKTVLLSPEFEQAYYYLALAQMDMDKTSEALATLDKARDHFRQNFVLEYLTGMAFGRQKAYTEALQHYTAAEVVAQATDPKRLNEGFYFQFGAACERKGDYSQAETYFQKSLQLDPNFAEALNYLGYMWAEHGMKLDQARQLIEKALKVEPKNAAYLDSMAWVLFKTNQPKDALPFALEAAELSQPADATVYDHLGDIYSALHQPEQAREAWRKSLALDATDEVRKKLGLGLVK